MEIRNVGVVGLGTMGAGIAQVSVQAGYETVGREVSDELARRGRATIDRYLTRGVGMHFFNPAPVLPLVEVVRAPNSSDDAVRTAYEWAERAGKRPVICNDTPGFIVNRILIPLLNDCVRILDEAGVEPQAMDKAMTNGAGWPMGPCALIDLIRVEG